MSEASENATPVTGIEESDPNADSNEGLAGDLGVSSERKGPVLGLNHEVTHAAAPTPLEANPSDEPSEGEVAPEQSAHDDRPELNPESPGAHESDPDSNPGHGL